MAKKKKKQKSQTESKSPRRCDFFAVGNSDLWPLVITILIAVILRGIYLFDLRESIFYGNYILDSKVIDAWASTIANGDFWGDGAFFRAPLYPYLVGGLYALFGHSPMAVIPWQFVIGVLTVILTYFYARYLFGLRVAKIAGVVAACWPTLIYFEGELMLTSMVVFLAMSAIVALHLALDTGKPKQYMIAGVLLGLAAITKPTVLPLVLIVPIYHQFKGGGDKWKNTAKFGIVYLIGLAIVILPVTIRNLAVADDPVLISSQGGANFYIGNSQYADGITVKMPQVGTVFAGGLFEDNIQAQSVSIARDELGREVSESEVSSYWYGQAFNEILSDPIRAAVLFAKKGYYFWHGQEIFNNKSLYYAREYSGIMGGTLWKAGFLNFPSGLLFPLMFVGVVFAWRQRSKTLVPLSYLLIYCGAIILFFVCARFRQPIVPVAIIFAVYGALELYRSLKEKPTGWLVAVCVFAVSLVAFNAGGDIESTENKSQYLNMVGTAYVQRGDHRTATEYLLESLRIAPGNGSATGTLAQAYVQAGRMNDAVNTLQEGIKLHPRAPNLYYNLGVIYANGGDLGKAKFCFHKSIEFDSAWQAPYVGLSRIYEHEGNADSAAVVQGLMDQAVVR